MLNIITVRNRIGRKNRGPERYYSGDDYKRYVSQPVEWDAKNFAKQTNDVRNADSTYRGSW